VDQDRSLIYLEILGLDSAGQKLLAHLGTRDGHGGIEINDAEAAWRVPSAAPDSGVVRR